MILRGTNGSGKSRALEMLLPFLLDADRRKMDATGAARVNFDELMRTGARDQANRTGYLWLELARPGEYLTVGALVRHSQSASSTKVCYFTTQQRVGGELTLLSDAREPLSRDALTELIGGERITDSAAAHRDRIRVEVFGLDGDTGRDRYDGLLQLLHTLRAPDVGNRIDEGRLPQILIDRCPRCTSTRWLGPVSSSTGSPRPALPRNGWNSPPLTCHRSSRSTSGTPRPPSGPPRRTPSPPPMPSSWPNVPRLTGRAR